MSFQDYLQIALYILLLALSAKPLGIYMDRVFQGERTFLSPILKPLEFLLHRILGLNPKEEQHWTRYTIHLLCFNASSLLLTYTFLRLQHRLPLNPMQQGVISPHLAFNMAMGFVTNADWQSYAGESTLTYLSQVLLGLENFISAATGLCVAVALIRGLSSKTIGNFWTDLLRAHLYLLLPLSLLLSFFLISQGSIQNFLPYQEVATLEGITQHIAMGPVASQVAIKILGSNGGGFFNTNSAHPYENPNPISNFIQIFFILLIPSALVCQLGQRVKQRAKNDTHARSVWIAMAIVFVVMAYFCAHFEYRGNPIYAQLGLQDRSNMEGKEARFGVFASAFFANATTASSCGAINAMHDSFTPLGGLVLLVNMLFSEVIFGGIGSGLYGMVFYIILTVFITGLMVGRTPEYLGKRIDGREVKYSMLALIIGAFSTLGLVAWASLDSLALAQIGNPAGHGFSEILYALSSATGNNGSAFSGLSTNTAFWNITLALAMFVGRYFTLIPIMAVAGSMAKKKIHPLSEGTLPAQGPLFIGLLIGVIVLVGVLTFFPALALGPISEHFDMLKGRFY